MEQQHINDFAFTILHIFCTGLDDIARTLSYKQIKELQFIYELESSLYD